MSTPTTPAPPKKGKGGRPRFVPTDEQINRVYQMCQWGVSHDDQARVIGIAPKTFKKAFKPQVQVGKSTGIVHAFGKFHQAIAAGKEWAIRLKLSVDAGYREPNIIQNQTLGADGRPIDPNTHTLKVKPEQIAAAIQKLKDEV